jgi:uncharacterized protein
MADEQVASKPLPMADDASRPFYEGGMEGKLMVMRCGDCGTYRLPSRKHCDECLSENTQWVQASGRGQVRTFGIMHQRYHPGFPTPYNLAWVELEEGPRLMTNIVGVADDQIRCGMPVVVEWEQHEDVAIPKFRPA